MSEKLSLKNKIGRIAAAAVVGATLASGCDAIKDLQTRSALYECTLSNSCPPVDGQTTRVRSSNNGYAKIDEAQTWNPEVKKWRTTDIKVRGVPQPQYPIEVLNSISKQAVIDQVKEENEFFNPPISENPDCKNAYWRGQGYVFTYCWDKDSSSWQESGEEPLVDMMR